VTNANVVIIILQETKSEHPIDLNSRSIVRLVANEQSIKKQDS